MAVHKAVPGHPFRTILAYNRPYWRAYAGGAILAFVFVLVGLATPLVIRAVVDQFERGTMSSTRLLVYFGVLIGIAAATGVGRYYQRTLMIGASRWCEYDLRNDYFRHVAQLGQDFFHRVKTGDIMARAVNDLNHVCMFIGPGLMGTVDMVRLPYSLALMIYLSGRLTLIAILPMPLVSLMVYGFVMYMHRQSERVQSQFSRVTSRAQENLAGVRVVKAYGAADREERDFRRESAEYMRLSMRLAMVMNFARPLIGTAVGLTMLLVLWSGGVMVIEGTMSLGDLMGFTVCLMMLVWPLVEFGWVLTLYQRGAVSMNRINEIFAEVPSIRDDERTCMEITSVEGAVAFDAVTFAHGDRVVLEGVTFDVPAGKSVAVVGPTGSGKSSIVALLTREYDPTAGRVLIDGEDARRIPVRVLRDAIGYVPQDTFLFSDTIRANVTLGRPEASQEAIDHACEVAQFRETVEALEEGYETLLGERGINLSGGQKQRLAIARAVLRDPKILVLDDALSNVDTHTEERILEGLRGVMAARTSIIISHRVSTVRHADEVLVIRNGRIVERGAHESLLTLGGVYADMYARQQLEDELEET
ncbi:MAG TPA: ABC transporter ATP-binding protein [Candidatus Hydrogenedentes bacterium]|nr:ABC transporter ATP-binding protein [Candidatus Hydrogenedentota bacterium]HPG65480.1 ABC transporter ATP-binding protein [Candidatus Hydrogenedentota bacterium]